MNLKNSKRKRLRNKTRLLKSGVKNTKNLSTVQIQKVSVKRLIVTDVRRKRLKKPQVQVLQGHMSGQYLVETMNFGKKVEEKLQN